MKIDDESDFSGVAIMMKSNERRIVQHSSNLKIILWKLQLVSLVMMLRCGVNSS